MKATDKPPLVQRMNPPTYIYIHFPLHQILHHSNQKHFSTISYFKISHFSISKMGFSQITLLLLVQLSLINLCLGTRKLNSLYQPPPMSLTYHKRRFGWRKPPNFHSLVWRFLTNPEIHCLRLSPLSKPTKPTTTKTKSLGL